MAVAVLVGVGVDVGGGVGEGVMLGVLVGVVVAVGARGDEVVVEVIATVGLGATSGAGKLHPVSSNPNQSHSR